MKKRSSNSVSRVVLSSRHTNLLERARAFPVEAVRPWGDKAKFTAEYCDVRPLPCALFTSLVPSACSSSVLLSYAHRRDTSCPADRCSFWLVPVAGGPDPGRPVGVAVGEEAEITGASR